MKSSLGCFGFGLFVCLNKRDLSFFLEHQSEGYGKKANRLKKKTTVKANLILQEKSCPGGKKNGKLQKERRLESGLDKNQSMCNEDMVQKIGE